MLQKLQSLWQKHAYRIGKGKFAELWAFAAVNLVIGPLAALANWRASKRPEGELPVHSTSLLLEVTVV
jgi:hypothetical protein